MKNVHAIVVDQDGNKVEFVLVHIDEETGHEEVVYYNLRPGEQLIYDDVSHALSMVKPRWNGDAWNEMATDEELAAARPEPEPTQPDPRDLALAELSSELFSCQKAIAELSIAMVGGEA